MNRLDRTRRFAVSCGYAGASALLFYATDRARSHFLGHEANPATIIWSRHAGFFWREIGSLFVAGFAFQISWLMMKEHGTALDEWLPKVLLVSVALATAQALFVP